MAKTVIADASYLVALLSQRDSDHDWAVAQASSHTPPWQTCEAALSETYHLLGLGGLPPVHALLRRHVLVLNFHLDHHTEAVIRLMERYANVPMSIADACLVRMTEILPDPLVLTTDSGFRIYRRHSRLVIPCGMPS